MGDVLVFGSINTDLVTYLDRLPGPGETVTGGRFQTFPGGKGANQAVAAARAGAGVQMFGCVGDDTLGRERLASLEKDGVSVRHVVVKAGAPTGIAQVLVDRQGENMIAVAAGANALFSPADVPPLDFVQGSTEVALFQNEVPQATTEALMADCRSRGLLVLWNLAPVGTERPSGYTLQAVDYLICNQGELRTLAGAGDGEALARQIMSWGVGSVVVTLGEKGALVVTESGVHAQPAFPVAVMDTVGSGDCFCGVFAASLSFKSTVNEALRRACAAAALSASARGAQTSMPSATEVDEYLATQAERHA